MSGKHPENEYLRLPLEGRGLLRSSGFDGSLLSSRGAQPPLAVDSRLANRDQRYRHIALQLCGLIKNSLPAVDGVWVVLRGEDGFYRVEMSDSGLCQGRALFDEDHPLVRWVERNQRELRLTDFYQMPEFRLMSAEKRRELKEMYTDYAFPLLYAGQLIGLCLITCADYKDYLPREDVDFIYAMDIVTIIAIEKYRLYDKAREGTAPDELTGLMDRKALLREMEARAARKESMALILLSLDDFGEYNRQYGSHEGNLALRRVANLLVRRVGRDKPAARYAGNAFAVLLADAGMEAACELAGELHEQVLRLNRRPENRGGEPDGLRTLKNSVGICGSRSGIYTPAQLCSNVETAVRYVRRSGKNRIAVFSEGMEEWTASPAGTPEEKRKNAYSAYASVVYALTAAIDAKDHYTFAHSDNVSYYATQLAIACGLPAEEVETVREAGLLHDIGKIGISEEILNKPGQLTDEEYAIIKEHPVRSANIIRYMPNLEHVIPAVLNHHERWDGKGYPAGLRGEQIPLHGRILCVADCFDAMTGRRCYQDGRDVEEALQELHRNAGRQFDPKLALLFEQKVREGMIELCQNPAESPDRRHPYEVK